MINLSLDEKTYFRNSAFASLYKRDSPFEPLVKHTRKRRLPKESIVLLLDLLGDPTADYRTLISAYIVICKLQSGQICVFDHQAS